jgi:hypothetical protein
VKPSVKPTPAFRGLPEGNVNRAYRAIPELAAITPDKIRITAGAAQHIVKIFINHLFDMGEETEDLAQGFELRLLQEVKHAIPRGIVLSNYPTEDANNPSDRQIAVHTYLDLRNVDPQFFGNAHAEITVSCRLSPATGTISVRTISKRFEIKH